MKRLHSFAIVIPFAAVMMFAQQPPQPQDPGYQAQEKNQDKDKKETTSQADRSAGQAAFAISADDGHCLEFDEAGNGQVKSELGAIKKNMKASATGAVEGDTLKVQKLEKHRM